MTTFRFRVTLVLALLIIAATAVAQHSWHTWVLDRMEYVYDANERLARECTFVCTTDINNPHYKMTLGTETSCPVP